MVRTINQISSSCVCSLRFDLFHDAFWILQTLTKTFMKWGYMRATDKWGPPFGTARRDLIDGTIDSLIHASSWQRL